MFDRLLARVLDATVLCLIALCGAIGLMLGYRGLFNVLAGRFSGVILIVIAAGLTCAAYHLCRHRRFLADA